MLIRTACRLSLLACLLCTLPAAFAQEPGEGWVLQFADDFERDELGPDWLGSVVEVRDGALFLGRDGDMGNNFVYTRQSFPGAQWLEFDATAPTDQPCDLSAVLNTDSTGYKRGFLFGFGSQMNSFSQLVRRNEQLLRYDAKIVPHKTHRIICRREGNRFTHIIDGTVVADYTHPGPLPGPLSEQIGFYSWHLAKIDNVRIYTKPEQVQVVAVAPVGAVAELTAVARSYPDPGKIVVSVDTPWFAEIPDDTNLRLEVTLEPSHGGAVLQRAGALTQPQMREEIILDAQDLPAGEYMARVRLPEMPGEELLVEVSWPGRSEAFRNIKILNNFVWELLDARPTADRALAGPYTVTVPYDRWLFVRTTAAAGRTGTVTVTLDPQGESLPLTAHGPDTAPTLEAMRFVRAGEHTVQVAVAGDGALAHLQVRAVPEIQHSRFPTSLFLDQGVKYDWDFISRHILPQVNTIISGGLPESALPYVEQWKEKGGRWITYGSRPGLSGNKEVEEQAETIVAHYAPRPGYQHPLLDGILVDEFYTPNDPTYPNYTQAARMLNERFPGKAFYPYAAGSFGKDEASMEFAAACIEGGGYICWEAYLYAWETQKQALNVMRRYPERTILPMEEKLPGATRHTIWVFGTFSFPWPYADGFAHVNYNAYLDMQFQLIATHPALFGLGGVHIWRSGYSDEERLRWFGRYFRHYCIEGETSRYSTNPYLLTHIRNPEFTQDTAGWQLQPAAEGSIYAAEQPEFGKFIGRYYRGPDTFLVTRREAAGPNVFSQTITGLQIGRLYSVKMFSGDYDCLQATRSEKAIHPVSLEIEGGELLEGHRYNYQEPFQTRNRLMNFTQQEPFWLNYHWRVFRATGTTAQLRVADWKSPTDPGGPVGQQLLYTFIEVKPYLEDAD